MASPISVFVLGALACGRGRGARPGIAVSSAARPPCSTSAITAAAAHPAVTGPQRSFRRARGEIGSVVDARSCVVGPRGVLGALR
jgi:hypothetical protein